MGGQLAVAAPSLPQGTTQLVFRLTATAQSPTVSSAFYRCGAYMVP